MKDKKAGFVVKMVSGETHYIDYSENIRNKKELEEVLNTKKFLVICNFDGAEEIIFIRAIESIIFAR